MLEGTIEFQRIGPYISSPMRREIPAWQRQENLFLVPAGGWLVVTIVLLSVFLAGGRPIWSQGVIAAGLGLLWIIWPPAKTPAKPVAVMLGVLALAPLAAYLPASWLALPEWRVGLRQFSAVTPSGFVTPQPWFTFHVWLLWLCGMALAAWCACRDWDHYNRGTLARMYAGGMLCVVLFAIFGCATGYQPSWWQSTDGFGPFLNRNQWGSALGFAGVVAIALVHQCVRQQHKRGIIFWVLAAAVFAGAAIYNGSRGGVVVLVAGGFAYWSFYGLLRKQYRYAAIALSFLCISFALFTMGGGSLLERFVGLRGLMEGGLDEDGRIQFYRMTMAMVADAPLTGFGLGNFEYVFPFYLDFEPMFDLRPLHPESSWLWLLSEGGWLLVVAMTVALIVLVAQGYSARRSRAATARSIGLACAVLLAFNSFFEVSGHRLGTLFPVILLASLALPPTKEGEISGFLRGLARAAGGILLATGLLWILAGTGVPLLPSVQGVAALQQRALSRKNAGQDDQAIGLLEQCESLRPLDWNFHWTLSGWLLEKKQIDEAWQEFRAANALLPYLYWTIERQAEKWIEVSPGRAASAILEAMARAPKGKRVPIYASFLRKSAGHAALRTTLFRLFPDDSEYEFVRIQQSPPDAAAKRLARFIRRTENLALVPDHLVAPVLRFMLDQGKTEDIDRIVAENPRLKRAGWQVLVEREARGKRIKEALELYFNYGPRPALPASLSRSDLRSVERAAALAPMDIATAIAYYQALAMARRDDDAFWQLRRIMESPLAPPYIWFLAAQAAHRRGDYEEAWGYLQTYREKTKQ